VVAARCDDDRGWPLISNHHARIKKPLYSPQTRTQHCHRNTYTPRQQGHGKAITHAHANRLKALAGQTTNLG
jgi:hypothetical protein